MDAFFHRVESPGAIFLFALFVYFACVLAWPGATHSYRSVLPFVFFVLVALMAAVAWILAVFY